MTPERWQHIDKLLEEALEIEASDRAAFLDQACAGDEALRRKIEDLLAAHARAQSFIETPAMEAAAQALARQARSMVGRQLDHYQILSFLGKGGMGEVYCARDTMLDRQVALKFLPAAVAADQDRLRRFIHEARAASAINHPNVATVYEIREIDGINFIAMEYVEGLTLQARLDSCTLEPADVVEFGFQIADALEAAHTRGIMHRDIKPANLMLTPRGQVKVLDFGLAKMTRVAELSEGGVGTLVTTAPGMVLGTVRYMSPEQVLGRELDHRTDIFSLGVVLFEMATGRLPFGGESVGEAMDQILHASPDSLTHFNDQAPAELERIVHKCLEKDRERRYQSARELMVDLRNLKRDSSAGTIVSGRAAPPSVSRTRRYALLALAVLIIVLGGIAWGLYKLSGQNQSQTTSSSAEPRVVPITNFPGYETQPSFSPDGNQLAFVRNGDIYVTLIGAGEPLRLTNDSARELDPVWSPDGRHLAFIRAGAVSSIYLIPALGGPERKLAEAFPQRPFNKSSLSYSPDGKFMAVADKAAAEPFSIFLLLLETGEKRRLTLPPGGSLGDGSPAFSPDGRMLAFARMPSDDISDIYVVPVNGGEPKRLTYENTNTFGLTWTPDSRSIVFSSRGKSGFLPHLWRIPATGGAPEQVAVFAQDLHSPTISRQGRRLAYTQVIFDVNIWRIGLLGSAGKEVAPTKLVYSTVIETSPDYSPDGKRIAFTSLRAGIPEIWVCDSNGENPIQLTSLSSSVTGAPRWSPDGGQIAFESLFWRK